MMTCEFKLMQDGSVIGTKELETLPEVDDEVTVEGETYRVNAVPSNEPDEGETMVIHVRRATSM